MIPEAAGYAEIAVIVEVMVQRVAAAIVATLLAFCFGWNARMASLIEMSCWQMKEWHPLDARWDAAKEPFHGIWICAHAYLPVGHAYIFWIRDQPNGPRHFDKALGIHPQPRF